MFTETTTPLGASAIYTGAAVYYGTGFTWGFSYTADVSGTMVAQVASSSSGPWTNDLVTGDGPSNSASGLTASADWYRFKFFNDATPQSSFILQRTTGNTPPAPTTPSFFVGVQLNIPS